MVTRPKKAAVVAGKPNFDTLLGQAKLPEMTVPICLRGDLAAEHELLDRQLEKLVDQPVAKLGGDGRGELKQRIQALEAEMESATYPFRLRALSRPAYREFTADHPPRKTDSGAVDERDEGLGVNAETFFEALIRRCLVDPVLDDDSWARLVDALTDRQYNRLADVAFGLNRRDVDVPFSHAASQLNRSSGPA